MRSKMLRIVLFRETDKGVEMYSVRGTSETDQIVADAKKNGTYMKAPNSDTSKLAPFQWVQVRTKAFKEWFGDWNRVAGKLDIIWERSLIVYTASAGVGFGRIARGRL